MHNDRKQFAFVRKSGSWLLSQSVRVLSGVGIASISPQFADAARKNERRDDNQDRKDNESGDNRNDRQESNQNDQKSDRDTNSETKAESRNANSKSDNSDKQGRSESRSEEDDRAGQAESEDSTSRREAKRQDADGESRESAGKNPDDNGDDNQGGGRRSREFEQQVDDRATDVEPETVTVLQTNPNVVIDDVPETSVTDLVVEANEDVIASVSARGGFAFARSGGVTAVTGPDGASIIQTGDVDTGTSTTPTDDEPSDDGGNNDLDFSS